MSKTFVRRVDTDNKAGKDRLNMLLKNLANNLRGDLGESEAGKAYRLALNSFKLVASSDLYEVADALGKRPLVSRELEAIKRELESKHAQAVKEARDTLSYIEKTLDILSRG